MTTELERSTPDARATRTGCNLNPLSASHICTNGGKTSGWGGLGGLGRPICMGSDIATRARSGGARVASPNDPRIVRPTQPRPTHLLTAVRRSSLTHKQEAWNG